MNNESIWFPTDKQNLGIVSETYYLIKNNLEILQKETDCPDKFIYDFLRQIQNEWNDKSCQSIVRNKLK